MNLLLALPIPLLALAWVACQRQPRTWVAWRPSVITVAILLAIGGYASAPFHRGVALGTGEAANYSLAIADAVTQSRAGVFPVLVGQTDFAFNGRIHPLRTAPYYCHAACVLDWFTFRKLSFWQLQNLLLTLSLVGAAFSCYAVLRGAANAPREVALGGTALYVLAPAVMAVGYAMDLYMTVTTLPFVPWIVGANLRSFTERSRGVYLTLGLALGICWLAHPPIAIWSSLVTVLLQAAVWLRPGFRPAALLAIVPGALVGLGLVSFAFASNLTLQEASSVSGGYDYSPLFAAVAAAWPAALRPISTTADQLGDFQLGYAGWALFAVATAWAGWRRHWGALALLAVAAFLLVLVLPVPGVTVWLWQHLPPALPNLTNSWPMQRLYVPVTLLVLFAAALAWTDLARRAAASDARQWMLRCAGLALIGWTLWQTRPFLNRAYSFQRTTAATVNSHRLENVNLTVTSYALVGVGRHYTHGVADPAREFRLLRLADQKELANNWTETTPPAEPRMVTLVADAVYPDHATLRPVLSLQPGRKYLLKFHFRVPPADGVLSLRGPTLLREYYLPAGGEANGFGMNPGNDPSLVVWTSARQEEEVRVSVHGAVAPRTPQVPFADLEFRVLDPANFPVQVTSLLPLRGRVRSPEAAWLETPRRYVGGYVATVDGRAVETAMSTDRTLMIRVPAGEHSFEVRYVGPFVVRATAWLLGLTLLGLAIAGTIRALPVVRATIAAYRRPAA